MAMSEIWKYTDVYIKPIEPKLILIEHERTETVLKSKWFWINWYRWLTGTEKILVIMNCIKYPEYSYQFVING